MTGYSFQTGQDQQRAQASESRQAHRLLVLSVKAIFALLLAVGTTLMPSAASASLSSSGSLTLPSTCPGAPGCGSLPIGVFPSVVNTSGTFTGNWLHTVDVSYWGSFSGTGVYPAKGGTNLFDFTGLTNNVLPSGTLFVLGDLDDGSGPEHFSFQAQDARPQLRLRALLVGSA